MKHRIAHSDSPRFATHSFGERGLRTSIRVESNGWCLLMQTRRDGGVASDSEAFIGKQRAVELIQRANALPSEEARGVDSPTISTGRDEHISEYRRVDSPDGVHLMKAFRTLLADVQSQGPRDDIFRSQFATIKWKAPRSTMSGFQAYVLFTLLSAIVGEYLNIH